MTPNPQLTSVQSDLVALLHEIGGVIEEERGSVWNQNVPPQPHERVTVQLTMTGDNLRRVRVLIDPYGDVEWEVLGEGSC